MRVVHFFKTYLPDTTGGIEQVIFQLCQGSRALGVMAEVVTLSPNPHPSGIQVADHDVWRAKQDFYLASTGFSRQVFQLFRERVAQADLVHFHFPWPMMDLVHFATRHGRPSVVTYHSDIVRQSGLLRLYRPLMQHFLADMQGIVVSSPQYLETSPVLSAYRDKVSVIPFGLDRAAYPAPSEERLAYWRANVGPKFFLFVGVLRYYKGLHVLLEALQGLPYPVFIVGSGPEEQALKAQAQRLHLTQVHFLGRLDDEDKGCLLQLCYAFVFPSPLRSEAFGISLLEAALYGKPMISCEIGTGTSFINQNNETGLVINPEDVSALRQALTYLWDHPVEAQRMGQNAAQRFEQQFTASRMCQDTVNLYQNILNKGACS